MAGVSGIFAQAAEERPWVNLLPGGAYREHWATTGNCQTAGGAVKLTPREGAGMPANAIAGRYDLDHKQLLILPVFEEAAFTSARTKAWWIANDMPPSSHCDHDRRLELLAERGLVGLDADQQRELESFLQARPDVDAESLDRNAAGHGRRRKAVRRPHEEVNASLKE
jgi:hypothetical protein